MIIITSTLNAPETVAILNHLQNFNHSKILIVDIIGAVLNNQNEFYRNINSHQNKWLSNNLLVLTILSEKFKRFLNKTFATEYKRIYDESTLHRFHDADTNITDFTRPPSAPDHFTVPTVTLFDVNGNGDGRPPTSSSATWIKQNAGAAERLLIKLISNDNQTESIGPRSALNGNDAAAVQSGGNDDNSAGDQLLFHNQLHHYVQKFLNKSCGESCENVISSKLNCAKYLAMVKSFNSTDEIEFMCEYLVNVWKMAPPDENGGQSSEQLPEPALRRQRRRRWTPVPPPPPSSPFMDAMATALANQTEDTVFGEYFGLFDFVATTLMGELDAMARNENASSTYDFIVLDFRLATNGMLNETTFVWRPLLILQQSQLNQQLFTTHPLLPGHHWLLNNSNRFWTCGLICWILAGIIFLLLICIVMASVTVGIAIR